MEERKENISGDAIPSRKIVNDLFTYFISTQNFDAEKIKDKFSEISSEDFSEESTVAQIQAIQREGKNLITTKLDKALEYTKSKLKTNCDTFDDLITQLSRYNRINKAYQRGIIEYQDFNLEIIKIENALIYVLNHLEEDELR